MEIKRAHKHISKGLISRLLMEEKACICYYTIACVSIKIQIDDTYTYSICMTLYIPNEGSLIQRNICDIHFVHSAVCIKVQLTKRSNGTVTVTIANILS